MGCCFSCIVDSAKSDLSSNSGMGIVNTQVNVMNVATTTLAVVNTSDNSIVSEENTKTIENKSDKNPYLDEPGYNQSN